MPTTLDKPATPAAPIQPSELLRRRHNWERWRTILFIALIGLAATFIAVLVVHQLAPFHGDWKILAGTWIAGLLITALAALFGWSATPPSLIDTAHHMDEHLMAKNRLEAAATLQDSASPLAKAQREETADYLRRAAPNVRPVRALPWLMGGLLLIVVAHLITMLVWVVPALTHPVAATPPPKKETPKASITWKSPEAETKANPVEEVPTVAVADSSSGLKNLSLEISVNGVAKKSTPLPATPFDKAGRNTIKSSLYMDELGVEPFDIVSYYIKGNRIANQELPETASAIQFVQVRPFRDDLLQAKSDPGDNPDYDLLIRLKLAQLKSVKENFVLAHTDLPVDNPLRKKENDLVGKNQGDLAAKTEEVVQKFIQDGVDANVVDLLQQAEPPMKDASQKILATYNKEALEPQQKALSIIIEIEKFFIKMIGDKGAQAKAKNPPDPFKDKQKHEMKKRSETVAGQLELLAKNQTKLAGDISHSDKDAPDQASGNSGADNPSPDKNAGTTPSQGGAPAPGTPNKPAPGNPAPAAGELPGEKIGASDPQAVDPFGKDADKGTLAERQARVLQGIAALLNNNNVLPPAVNDALQAAQKDATASIRQLDKSDTPGASEPSANAAHDLQRALAEMNKAGEEDTKLAMQDAQQQLNDTAQKLNDMAKDGAPDAANKLGDMAQKVNDVQKALEKQADKQQEAGTASGAQRLEHLADAMAGQKIDKDLSAMSKTGMDVKKALADADKLKALAAQAAQDANIGKPTPQDLAKLINSLEASRANLARIAERQEGLPPRQLGATPGEKSGNEAAGKGDENKAPGQGQQPGKDDHGAGQQPGKDAGGQQAGKGDQGQGQQPGKDGQQAGKGDQGQQPGKSDQGQGQGQEGQGQSPQGKGEGQGEGQGKTPQGQGQGQGEKGDGQGPGEAKEGQGQGQGTGSGSAGAGGTGVGAPLQQAYQETLEDIRDEAQTAKATMPATNNSELLTTVEHAQETVRTHPNSNSNAVAGYQMIAKPLDQLILDLQKALSLAQREQVMKQPNLDDAPAAYRSAVSDYFETMSKNYHPDSPDADKK